MEFQDVDIQEIEPFFRSLGAERDLVQMSVEGVLNAEFVAGARVDNNLAGIGGIMKRFLSTPELFIVVKFQYQKRGLGNEIMQKLISFVKRRYSFLTLTTHRAKEYAPAVSLYRKNNFKVFKCPDNRYFMCLPFNLKGKILCWILSHIYVISFSPLGKILQYVYNLYRYRFYEPLQNNKKVKEK
jgi:GNAT superfamily N-acetyltransferase